MRPRDRGRRGPRAGRPWRPSTGLRRPPVEKALTELWEKTLGFSPIGVDDHFFDLGGDSIEAIQIQHAIHRDFDLRIKNTEFLANPTIAALAALIAECPGAVSARSRHDLRALTAAPPEESSRPRQGCGRSPGR